MNLNNTATIGLSAFLESPNQISFYQNDYLVQYDCIIASTTAMLNEIKATGSNIQSSNHNRMEMQIEKRQDDLREFYSLGGVVILIIDENPIWEYLCLSNGGIQINIVDILSTEQPEIEYSPQNGKGITASPLMPDGLNQAESRFTSVLKSTNHEALITTPRTKSPLSYHQKIDNGLFVALPPITLNEGVDQNTFLQNLLEMCEWLKAGEVVV